MLLLAVLAACTPSTLVELGGGNDGKPADTASDGEVEQLGGDTSAEDTGDDEADTGDDDPDTWPKACPELYDPDLLPEFELEFDDAEWAGMQRDCQGYVQEYRPVTFTYDGESVPAYARLKGNWSWSCEKFQFVISFNEDDEDARFRGQRKLMLDAPWYDHSLLHERLAYPMFAELGLAHSCVNTARLTVQGRYYGVYTNLERIDKEYLERNYEDSEGNLYQGGVELKTNEDEADTRRLTELQAARTVEEIEALVNLDQAVAEWAMEAMIPATDNYWAGVEINYYLYDHPTQGFVYFPSDLDISFGDSAYPGGGGLIWPGSEEYDPITHEHTGWGKETLLKTVLADRFWCERFVEELQRARSVYDPEELRANVVTWSAQIEESVNDDPNLPFSVGEHDAAVTHLSSFFQERADYVDAWLAEGDHCPARW